MDIYKKFADINVRAVEDDNTFREFKRMPDYTYMLEHVSPQQANEYINVVLTENPELLDLDKIEMFAQNDSIGNPVTFQSMFGKLSPTLFRYIKVLSDLKNHFSSLDGMNIIEIGAGNGGQCNIISKIFSYKSYTIVDLPDVIKLQKKCLNILGTPNVTFEAMKELNEDIEYDLVVSNYAFSEIPMELRKVYIDKVLSKSVRGYLTMNDGGETKLEERLPDKHIEILEEFPKTGPDNYIAIWR